MDKTIKSIITRVPTAVKAVSGDKQSQMRLIEDVARVAVKAAKNKRKRQKKRNLTALGNDPRAMVTETIPQPLAWGSQFKTVKPVAKTVTRMIDGQMVTGTVVHGSELLNFVITPPDYDGGYLIQAFQLAPRYSILQLLDQISMIYKRYKCDSLALKFYPFLPTTAAGRIGIYASADPASSIPTSFADFLRITQQQTANVYSEVALQISPNATGSYLPGPDSVADSANIRQTFTCQMGYAYEAPASVAPSQLGAIICAYEFFFWDLVDPTSVVNPNDYMLQIKVSAGQNVKDVKQFAPFWVQSRTDPARWKYFGSEAIISVESQGVLDGDYLISDYLPQILDANGAPLVVLSNFDSVLGYSSLTNVNPNIFASGVKVNLTRGAQIIFPDVICPAELRFQAQFSRVADSVKSFFDF